MSELKYYLEDLERDRGHLESIAEQRRAHVVYSDDTLDDLDSKINRVKRRINGVDSFDYADENLDMICDADANTINLGDLNKKINESLTYFDFERVRRHMEATNWKWVTSKEGSGIPTVSEMISTCERLFRDCIDSVNKRNFNGSAVTGTGGFEVRIGFEDISHPDEPEPDFEWLVELKFVVTEWTSYS